MRTSEFQFYYVLNENGVPVPTEDIHEVNLWLRNAKLCRVAKTHFVYRGFDVNVSTVFLVINRSYFTDGPPILFETMIFSTSEILDGYSRRYTSKAIAAQGHRAIVEHAKRFLREHRVRSLRRMHVAARRAQRGRSVLGGRR